MSSLDRADPHPGPSVLGERSGAFEDDVRPESVHRQRLVEPRVESSSDSCEMTRKRLSANEIRIRSGRIALGPASVLRGHPDEPRPGNRGAEP
jgi:hypothetical protein